jgi:23S rRNA pseudouridine2604 synthase
MSGTDTSRINKYIASSGLCSRREADRLIEEGRVTVNGIVAESGMQACGDDVVLVDGKNIIPETNDVYIAFNKPLGVTCTTDSRDPSNIIDYIGYPERIFPIGRLDKNSSGLILLTNDGSIVNTLLRAENNHEKEYQVTVDRPYDDKFIKEMQSGIPVLGQITLPCKINRVSARVFRIILHQGLNRQIRRMCEYEGYKVVKLRRIRFMNINLGTLGTGQWRYLTAKEVNGLKSAAS